MVVYSKAEKDLVFENINKFEDWSYIVLILIFRIKNIWLEINLIKMKVL